MYHSISTITQQVNTTDFFGVYLNDSYLSLNIKGHKAMEKAIFRIQSSRKPTLLKNKNKQINNENKHGKSIFFTFKYLDYFFPISRPTMFKSRKYY